MDLNEIVKEKTDLIIENKLEEMIENQLSKTLESIVNDSLKEYSDFGKALKEKVSESLNVSLNKLDLRDYTSLIIDKIKQIADEKFINSEIKEIENRLKSIIGKLPPEINLSDIVEMFKSHIDDFDKEDNMEITFLYNYDSGHKWHKISLDKESDKNEKDCNYEMIINNDGHLFVCRFSTTWVSNKKEAAPIKMAMSNDFQMLLLRLKKSLDTKIIIDTEHVDIYHSGYDD